MGGPPIRPTPNLAWVLAQNGTEAGVYLALSGAAEDASRTWGQTAERYRWSLRVEAGSETEARRLWAVHGSTVVDDDRSPPAAVATDARREGPVDPAAQGLLCIFLSYCRLRTGDPGGAMELIGSEAALRSAAPTPEAADYYAGVVGPRAHLAAIVGRLSRASGGVTDLLEAYLRATPTAGPHVLDLQWAYPERVPALLPPPASATHCRRTRGGNWGSRC